MRETYDEHGLGADSNKHAFCRLTGSWREGREGEIPRPYRYICQNSNNLPLYTPALSE